MNKTRTKEEEIRSNVDRLLQNNTFITLDMIGISLHAQYHNNITYEMKIVFQYMKELGIDYVRYSDKYSDKRMHGNNRGFYNDIKERRKRKLQSLMRLNHN